MPSFAPALEEVLLTVGKFMSEGAWLVKGLTFDGHHAHRFLKEALYGSFNKLDVDKLSELPFWKDVTYAPIPRHCIPHLPLQICMFQGESIWGLAGACSLADFQEGPVMC